mmetsp:Transcript_24112/g.69587  ORF Transcript_24112/g.69587 Transcript_24112/m.69587 type:complete len:203 (-) Transcript_24112:463-1071(-)
MATPVATNAAGRLSRARVHTHFLSLSVHELSCGTGYRCIACPCRSVCLCEHAAEHPLLLLSGTLLVRLGTLQRTLDCSVLWFHLCRPLQHAHRLTEEAQLLTRHALAVERLRVIGIQLDRLVAVGDTLARAPKLEGHQGQVEVQRREELGLTRLAHAALLVRDGQIGHGGRQGLRRVGGRATAVDGCRVVAAARVLWWWLWW